jgi:hypothetical protein
MAFLQTVIVALLLLINSIIAGTLGLLHLAQSTSIIKHKTIVASTTEQLLAPISVCDSKFVLCVGGLPKVYVSGYFLSDADPQTFEALDNYYGKDSSHIYWIIEGEEGPEPHEIVDADPQTFTPILGHEAFAKDKNHVYWLGYLISDADPATFSVVYPLQQCGPRCWFDSQDKNHKYLEGQAVK